MDPSQIYKMMETLAEINNLLMTIDVKGDNVYRLAKAMDLCVKQFEELEKNGQQPSKSE